MVGEVEQAKDDQVQQHGEGVDQTKLVGNAEQDVGQQDNLGEIKSPATVGTQQVSGGEEGCGIGEDQQGQDPIGAGGTQQVGDAQPDPGERIEQEQSPGQVIAVVLAVEWRGQCGSALVWAGMRGSSRLRPGGMVRSGEGEGLQGQMVESVVKTWLCSGRD